MQRQVASPPGVSRIVVVTADRNDAANVVQPLLARGGATLYQIGKRPLSGIMSKAAEIRALVNPAILRLRGAWGADDHLVVNGWLLLPILGLVWLGTFPQPRTILSLNTFVQSRRISAFFNALIRFFGNSSLCFVSNALSERDARIRDARVPPGNVLNLVWRERLGGAVRPDQIGDDRFLFAGGFANRDYDTMLRALAELPYKGVIVASRHNTIEAPVPPNVEILRDVDEAKFEAIMARSTAVVFPLFPWGDGCGHSTLLRALRNGKPVIATRHVSLVDYYGDDYEGNFEPQSKEAMRDAMRRVMEDGAFRERLAAHTRRCQAWIESLGEQGDEVLAFLRSREGRLGAGSAPSAI